MEKKRSKERQKAMKPPLKVTGQLAMPKAIPSWERDLLAVLIEAVDGSVQRKTANIGVPS